MPLVDQPRAGFYSVVCAGRKHRAVQCEVQTARPVAGNRAMQSRFSDPQNTNAYFRDASQKHGQEIGAANPQGKGGYLAASCEITGLVSRRAWQLLRFSFPACGQCRSELC